MNTRECVDDPDAVKTGSKAILCPKPRYCTTIKRFDYSKWAVSSLTIGQINNVALSMHRLANQLENKDVHFIYMPK